MLDCLYSFFFVSIHLNLWNNNRWIKARQDEVEGNRMGSDQRGRRQKHLTIQGGRSDRVYVFYHFFHLFYSSLVLILLLSDCLFLRSGCVSCCVFLLVLFYSSFSSPSSSFPIIYARQQAGLGQGRTGPTRVAIETRDETEGGGSTGM